jgi:hypothetical protein
LLWAVVNRYGPRGDLIVGSEGTGLGMRRAPGLSHGTRASYGPADDGSSTGAEVYDVWALLPAQVDRTGASDEVIRAGGDALSTVIVDTPRGAALGLSCLVRADGLDDVTRLLWRHGADDVRVAVAQRRRPERREVTVAVGRGNKKEPVRLIESRDAGELLRAEPDRDDVLAAARRLKVSPSDVHADALVAGRAQQNGDDEGA